MRRSTRFRSVLLTDDGLLGGPAGGRSGRPSTWAAARRRPAAVMSAPTPGETGTPRLDALADARVVLFDLDGEFQTRRRAGIVHDGPAARLVEECSSVDHFRSTLMPCWCCPSSFGIKDM